MQTLPWSAEPLNKNARLLRLYTSEQKRINQGDYCAFTVLDPDQHGGCIVKGFHHGMNKAVFHTIIKAARSLGFRRVTYQHHHKVKTMPTTNREDLPKGFNLQISVNIDGHGSRTVNWNDPDVNIKEAMTLLEHVCKCLLSNDSMQTLVEKTIPE